VLDDIRGRGIDQIYNLGDLAGKGARSDLAIDICQEVCQVVVRGNWDEGIATDQESPLAAWYREQIGAERTDYLRGLPNAYDFWLSGKRVRLFHASHIGVYHRVYSWATYEVHQSMFDNTPFTGTDRPQPHIAGYGDIHCAYMLSLYLDNKVLFNAGSVGNPLDMPLATYTILTGELDSQSPGFFSVDFVRLPYDIEAEVEAARRVNLPDFEAYCVELRTAVYRGRQNSGA
jgi:protein phosphatase